MHICMIYKEVFSVSSLLTRKRKERKEEGMVEIKETERKT